MARVRIDATKPFDTTIEVDGREVKSVRRVTFSHGVDQQLPLVELELIPFENHVVGEAEMEVVVSGVRLRPSDVDMLRQAAGIHAGLQELADRLECLFPWVKGRGVSDG